MRSDLVERVKSARERSATKARGGEDEVLLFLCNVLNCRLRGLYFEERRRDGWREWRKRRV